MSTHFADKLVLAPWALKQLGIDDFDRLSKMLRAPEFEGWAAEQAARFDYAVRFLPVGPNDPVTGAPTQMGVFRRG